METWTNQVAVITDCENVVGVKILQTLAKAGMIAIGLGQNVVNQTKTKLDLTTKNIQGKCVFFKCDVTNIEHLHNVFEEIIDTYKGIDVLINNAYCDTDCHISNGSLEDFRKIIDTNIYALVACTRFAAGSMLQKKTRGHIINISNFTDANSEESKNNVNAASRTAMSSVNEILRHEFRYLKANIKVTNVLCGTVENVLQPTNEPKLKIEEYVANFVEMVLSSPEHLQIHEVFVDFTFE